MHQSNTAKPGDYLDRVVGPQLEPLFCNEKITYARRTSRRGTMQKYTEILSVFGTACVLSVQYCSVRALTYVHAYAWNDNTTSITQCRKFTSLHVGWPFISVSRIATMPSLTFTSCQTFGQGQYVLRRTDYSRHAHFLMPPPGAPPGHYVRDKISTFY